MENYKCGISNGVDIGCRAIWIILKALEVQSDLATKPDGIPAGGFLSVVRRDNEANHRSVRVRR